jgi:hypothetical protein
MSKIQCCKCDKKGHYVKDCRNPSKKPLSERPDAYQRAKSPAPDQRDPRTPSNAHVAVEHDDNTYEWSKENTGLGCVAVHTAPVSIRFNSIYLTDTVTNLPITTHTPAPSLLDDGDVESQPGPITVSPYVEYNEYQERQREFAAAQQAKANPYADEDVYSNSQSVANGPESD